MPPPHALPAALSPRPTRTASELRRDYPSPDEPLILTLVLTITQPYLPEPTQLSEVPMMVSGLSRDVLPSHTGHLPVVPTGTLPVSQGEKPSTFLINTGVAVGIALAALGVVMIGVSVYILYRFHRSRMAALRSLIRSEEQKFPLSPSSAASPVSAGADSQPRPESTLSWLPHPDTRPPTYYSSVDPPVPPRAASKGTPIVVQHFRAPIPAERRSAKLDLVAEFPQFPARR
ncbi:hypothetical protein OH77DRAFT_1522202 [Trametes cingulata]|nr:hypothetical protein OH77DRAFT_1522202 [Trametes cingulata]